MNSGAKSGSKGLEDLYSEEVCRVWFYLEEFDLSLLRENPTADMPDWLSAELSAVGWDQILEAPVDDDERATWALGHGIAPGQAFLVEIKPPHYFRCGNPWDGDDWDCEYNTTFLEAEPVSLAEAADRWEAWIKAGYPPFTSCSP